MLTCCKFWKPTPTICSRKDAARPGSGASSKTTSSARLPAAKRNRRQSPKQLGLSDHSLRRHLAEEGSSFGKVLDGVRRHLARRYLEDERVSLQQIAWLLGYSEIGAFNHAFKRWTGTSPGRARHAQSMPNRQN